MFRKVFRNLFNRDNLFIMIFVLILGAVIANIPINLEILNPVEETFSDFDITDIYFSRIRADNIEADERIVLINIGNLPREGIAEELRIINKYQPKVIGLDSFFRKLKKDNPAGDSLFLETLKEVDNLVMVTQVSYKEGSLEPDKETPTFDTLETSYKGFMQHAEGGFANLITASTRKHVLTSDLAGGLATCRTFSPQETLKDGTKELAFGVKLTELYDSTKARKFLNRKKDVEYINFRGNHEKFAMLDFMQLFEMEAAGAEEELTRVLKDNIVLLGFMGATIDSHSVIDKFYTPLNPKYIGKSEYDMYGVVVHANIISMILNEDYIDETPFWLDLSASFLIAYLSVALFSLLYRRMGFWFDGLSILAQLLITILILYLIIMVFDRYETRVDWGLGILALILSPNLLEIYFGLVKRLYLRTQRRLIKKEKKVIAQE